MTGAIAVCRDCAREFHTAPADGRCLRCGSPRLVVHDEIASLAIAHIDCDAFYAAVEKRDDPDLADVPVIVGGGKRGVVTTACYIARRYGVRSAMPMFKALEACPQATVIKPRMAVYAEVGQEVRALLRQATPVIEPISIDEAFLDLTASTERQGPSPAAALAGIARRIEREIGITVSIGLSYNKALAKIASDLDKPRGYAVIGREGVREYLAPLPVTIISGVGEAMRRRLAREGITRIAHLQKREEADLVRMFGSIGLRLHRFAGGVDSRPVQPRRVAKGVSAETTFEANIADAGELEARLWPQCERVAARAQAKGSAGRTVILKLRRSDFSIVTRSQALVRPTATAPVLFQTASTLLASLADGQTRYRLIGVGLHDLVPIDAADPPTLFDLPRDGTGADGEAAVEDSDDQWHLAGGSGDA